jgi:hypothetical protein
MRKYSSTSIAKGITFPTVGKKNKQSGDGSDEQV